MKTPKYLQVEPELAAARKRLADLIHATHWGGVGRWDRDLEVYSIPQLNSLSDTLAVRLNQEKSVETQDGIKQGEEPIPKGIGKIESAVACGTGGGQRVVRSSKPFS